MGIESIGIVVVIILILFYKPKKRVSNVGIKLHKLT